ncbi:MAG: hypothetical protein JXA21_24180 [Anaerolineae bacterium]|nr:hypothetical protein [Anaerolineae bacterium]
MRTKLRKHTFRDLIMTVMLIIAAFLGVFDILQKWLPADRIIMALLGVLAIDTLIEKLGYLHRIEENIVKLRDKPHSADNIFHAKDKMRSFDEWLKECKEMRVLGRDCIGLLNQYTNQIIEKTLDGGCFRFLIADPNDAKLMDVIATSSVLRSSGTERAQVIQQALKILEDIVKKGKKGSVEVKLINWVPTNSYVIVDPKKECGQMLVEPFGFKITSAQRRHMVLSRETDGQSYVFHLDQFEEMWKEAKPFHLTSP